MPPSSPSTDNTASNLLNALFVKSEFLEDEERDYHEVFRRACHDTTREVAGSANAARDIAQPAGKALLTMLRICRTAHVRDGASFVQNRQGSVGFFDSEYMPAFKSSSYRKKEVLGVRIGYGTTLRQMMRDYNHYRARLLAGTPTPPPTLTSAPARFRVDPASISDKKIKQVQLRDKLVEEGHLDALLRVVPERDPELYCFMLAIFFGLLCRPPPLTSEAILHPEPAALPLPTPDWEAVMHLQVFAFLRNFLKHLLLAQHLLGDLDDRRFEAAEEESIQRRLALEKELEERDGLSRPMIHKPPLLSEPPVPYLQARYHADPSPRGSGPRMIPRPSPPPGPPPSSPPPAVHLTTPVIKYMLSDARRPHELRPFEGVYYLIQCQHAERTMVYERLYDDFYLDLASETWYSRLGPEACLPADFKGPAALVGGGTQDCSGVRPGRMAVHRDVYTPFAPTADHRKTMRLLFAADGQTLLQVLDAQVGEPLRAMLQEELNKGQKARRDLTYGWLLDFHAQQCVPCPSPSSPSTSPPPPGASSPQKGGSGSAEGEEAKAEPAFAPAPRQKCLNRLTSGDLTALVMATFYWTPYAHTPLGTSLNIHQRRVVHVTWDLPHAFFLQHLMSADKGDLAYEVWTHLLRPPVPPSPWAAGGMDTAAAGQVFYLQDFISLMNAFGQTGDMLKAIDRFLRHEWTALRRQLAEAAQVHVLSLPAARLVERPRTTGENRAYIRLSTTEASTLVLQAYYWPDSGGGPPLPCGEFHVRLEFVDGSFRPRIRDFQNMLPEGVDPTRIDELVQFIKEGKGFSVSKWEKFISQVQETKDLANYVKRRKK